MNGNSFREFKGCSSLSEYILINQVGEGTFGEVHKAEMKDTRELVALKRLRIENEKEGFPITAIREVKLLKQLQHENVIDLLGMAVKRNPHQQTMEIYMVFPYLEHDLRGLLDCPKVIVPMSQIKTYVQQLFKGLEYLHSNNIIHRDLKCANLLINNQGILKIGDFGLARPYEPKLNAPLTNMVVTRWYRPPELLLGSTRYTEAIDIWGAGCIIAEMIKRKAMFPGTSDADQLDYIFKICGSPSDHNWPSWRDHLGPSISIQNFKPYQRNLTSTLKAIFETTNQIPDKLMISLLEHLLVLAPEKRPSAKHVLKDPWFFSEPLPIKPGNIPPITTDCHEYEVRKSREMKHLAHSSASSYSNPSSSAPQPHTNLQLPSKPPHFPGRPDYLSNHVYHTPRNHSSHSFLRDKDRRDRDRDRDRDRERDRERDRDKDKDWDIERDRSGNVRLGSTSRNS